MSRYKLYDVSPYLGLSIHAMLAQFHTKFGIGYEGPKRFLSDAELAFRLECHEEEAREYRDAVGLVDQMDALADEMYFLAGTAHRMGLNLGPVQVVGDAVEYDGVPRHLDAQTRALRLQLHESALNRFKVAAERQDMQNCYIALVAALQVFSTTAALHGFQLEEVVRRVHAANMEKNVDPAKQRRRALLREQGHDVEHMMEITKPDDWLPPYLGDLAGFGPLQDDTPKPVAMRMMAGNTIMVDGSKLRGLITVDGPDASGKTTLAKRITEVTGGVHIHLTWTPQLAEVMNEYRESAIRYASALAHDRVVVLERPWLSHAVYSDVYRAGVYDAGEVERWKKLTELAACQNVIALPSDRARWLQLYADMCATRRELHGNDLQNAEAILREFAHHFGKSSSPFFPHNVEAYDLFMHGEDLNGYIAEYIIPTLRSK